MEVLPLSVFVLYLCIMNPCFACYYMVKSYPTIGLKWEGSILYAYKDILTEKGEMMNTLNEWYG